MRNLVPHLECPAQDEVFAAHAVAVSCREPAGKCTAETCVRVNEDRDAPLLALSS